MASFLLRVFLLSSFILLIHSFSYSNSKDNYESNYSPNKNIDTIPSVGGNSFYVSNRGSDTNDGRSSATPKLNISSIETLISGTSTSGSATSLNLEANSIFREQLDPVNGNLHVSSFGLKNPKRLAKITGMDVIGDWLLVPNTNNVYGHLLKHFIDLSGPAYNYVMVAEIDTVLEQTHPISAVKYLTLVSDLEKCKTVPGTYYTPDITSNSAMVYIHPFKGIPGKSKFRYEVATRNFNTNGYNIDNVTYENLFLQTSGNGYGMLSGGKNTSIKNVIFQGGGTHHAVIKSGQIDSSLFLPGPKGLKDRIAAVFYSAEGKDGINKVTNTIFLDVPNTLYTHTNGAVNHKSLLLDKVYAFADTTDAMNGLSSNNTDSIEVNNCYVEGYPTGWWYGGGTKLTIKNSIFRKTSQSAIFPISKLDVPGELLINNVLIETNGNDNNQNLANGATAYGIRSIFPNLNVEVSNSIIHSFSTWHGPYQTVTTMQVAGLLKAHNNIYICDVNDNNSIYMNFAFNSGGKGTAANISSNNNAFILLRGTRFHWMVNPNNNNDQDIFTLSNWQLLTGQDKNSIFIDLRNNPLGLKAIFEDPDNGNWTLTHTLQADSIRKVTAGMTNPPLFYPKRPLVENDSITFKTPGGLSTFIGSVRSEEESLVQWRTFNEYGFSSFVIEYSLDGDHFMEAGSLKAVNNDQNNNYQFVHTHSAIDSIFYRLKYFTSDSSISYSSVIKLLSDFSPEFKITIYPNPFQQTITVQHPRRNNSEIRIYDYAGRLLHIIAVQSRSSKTLASLSHLPSGRYFVQWTSGKEKLSDTIVK
ncbi:MAG: T9SS type A sorting domain-containing protein [Chitinophagaceae bacterium]